MVQLPYAERSFFRGLAWRGAMSGSVVLFKIEIDMR